MGVGYGHLSAAKSSQDPPPPRPQSRISPLARYFNNGSFPFQHSGHKNKKAKLVLTNREAEEGVSPPWTKQGPLHRNSETPWSKGQIRLRTGGLYGPANASAVNMLSLTLE
jgi:hypothetical protein